MGIKVRVFLLLKQDSTWLLESLLVFCLYCVTVNLVKVFLYKKFWGLFGSLSHEEELVEFKGLRGWGEGRQREVTVPPPSRHH